MTLRLLAANVLHVSRPGSASGEHAKRFPIIIIVSKTQLVLCQTEKVCSTIAHRPLRLVIVLLFPTDEQKPGVGDRAHPSAHVVN